MYPKYTVPAQELEISADISLRESFDNMLFGSDGERPRGLWVVLQKVLRDKDNQPIKSADTYKLTHEGKHRDRGASTTRTGFYCSEKLTRVMYAPAGRMTLSEMSAEAGVQMQTRDLMFFSSREEIKPQDCVVFVKVDEYGNIVNPVQAEKEVVVTKVYPKYLDNGRVEFYVTIVEDEF